MLKTLGAQIREFKKDSLLTPVFMILEVFMETIIPLMMASIIVQGVDCLLYTSCRTSSGVFPCTWFQYWEETTGMELIVKYLFS